MAAAGLEDRTRQASIRGRRLVGPVRSLATRFSSAFGFFSLSGLGAGRLLSLSLFVTFSVPFLSLSLFPFHTHCLVSLRVLLAVRRGSGPTGFASYSRGSHDFHDLKYVRFSFLTWSGFEGEDWGFKWVIIKSAVDFNVMKFTKLICGLAVTKFRWVWESDICLHFLNKSLNLLSTNRYINGYINDTELWIHFFRFNIVSQTKVFHLALVYIYTLARY